MPADCPYSSDSESSTDASTADTPTKSAHVAHASARASVRLWQVHRSAVLGRSLRESEPLHMCRRFGKGRLQRRPSLLAKAAVLHRVLRQQRVRAWRRVALMHQQCAVAICIYTRYGAQSSVASLSI